MNVTEELANTRTLQRIVGPDVTVLQLPTFLRQHVPELPGLDTLGMDHAMSTLLHRTLVHPFMEMPSLENINGKDGTPRTAESLSSLVDHVVFSLVQRRERQRRLGRDGRNLLCQGFVVASDELARTGAQSMRSMPSGIIMMQMNHNVEYIKTQPLFRQLHSWVGDNVLRTMLMHCSIYIPLGSERENYLQLSGPPLRPRLESTCVEKKVPTKSSKRQRKRSRSRNVETSVNAVPQKLRPSATIRKDPLLYSNSYVPRIGLPTNHILQRNNPHELLFEMTSIKNPNGKVNKNRWKRLRRRGVEVCRRIIDNHRKCDYPRLLNRYCSVPAPFDKKDGGNCNLAAVSAAYSPSDAVASFLKSVVKRVFPEDLWGSKHNQECAMRVIHTFVRARRQEHLTNAQLMQGIRIKQIQWLRSGNGRQAFSLSDHETTNMLFLLVLRWTLEKFVIPLLSACFYVTETEFTGKQLVYYRKPVWALFRSLSMKKLLDGQYSEMPPSEAARKLATQKMGFSRLRLVPKETGVRPIATLSKAAPVSFETEPARKDWVPGQDDRPSHDHLEPTTKRRKLQSSSSNGRRVPQHMPATNSILNDAFAILRFEYEQDRSLFGSGLDGLHHFYPKYRQFIEEVKPRCTDVQLFMGSVDIKHCFDSINQEEMLKIVESILSKPDYCIQVHSQYRPFESMSRILRMKRTRVCQPEEIVPFPQSAHELASSSHKTIYADTVNCSVCRTEEILNLIKEHLQSHLVVTDDRAGDRYLLQSAGVPQGSTLSTLLCNFYYGRIEKSLLRDLQKFRYDDPLAKHLVCRQVDDFLFVGTMRHQLEDFLVAMLRGDQALGVNVNDDKTQVSTTVRLHQSAEKIQILSPKGSRRKFPWCGMLFDIATGEVTVDYSRFHSDKAGNSISVDRNRGQGEELLLQLKSFVRPRCIPILYDRLINSLQVQETNLFQMLAFAAIKMIVFMRARAIEMEKNDNLSFVLSCMESAISYATTLIRSRLDAVGAHWDVTPSRQKRIGWIAFHSVLKSYGRAQALVGAIDGMREDDVDESLDQRCRRALRSMELRKLM